MSHAKINKNLEEQAKALYKNRFIDLMPFKGTIPEEWHLGTVAEIIELHDAKRIPLSSRERANLAKIYPYYGATSVMDCVDRYLFDGIYLLLGEDGTVIDSKGYPILQYVEGKFWVNNHAHIITGKNNFSVELLYLLLALLQVRHRK
ncbi:restriction endonuclease subunit S [Murdochiella vaginalis]|uniref:restriction endonuclease subunit S n=1 Tax=Murdochiella vaginalis TaxID=1852373 RepID=UPI0008FE823C|nr:restriction endonuclease subunit S [Murdochiella vaginalis]